MKKATNILVIIMMIMLITGCGGGSTELPITVISQEDINAVNNLVPEREDIKTMIFEKIDVVKNEPNGAPNRSREIGEYYFSLSKRNTEVVADSAQVTYRFMYIEGYGTASADKYTGNIIFFYEKQYTAVQKWENVDIQVTFGEIRSGSITGIVKNKITDTAEVGVTVYAKAGEEQTVAVITDSNGQFVISGVLENTYTVYAMKDEFEIGSKESVAVTEGNTADIGIIYLLPQEDVRFASIEGYVYYNTEKTHRVEGAAVWVMNEDGTASNYLTATTNSEGYYQIRFVELGTFEVRARIENNYNEGEQVVIEESQIATGSVVRVNDIILPNTAPVIVFNDPVEETVEVNVGEEKTFTVTANDAEDIIMYYEWETNGGDLKFSIDNECIWEATEAGTFWIKVIVRDRMGLKAEHVWNIQVTELYYELGMTVNPSDSGTVTGNGTYEVGTVVSISAVANSGYIFKNWSGDVSYVTDINSASTTVVMPDQNILIVAEFEESIQDGTEEHPFLIYTAEDLNNIRHDIYDGDKIYYKQMADIDLEHNILSNESWYDSEKGWEPISTINESYFKGIYDGNGHYITNLYINRPDQDRVGLFSKLYPYHLNFVQGEKIFGGNVRNLKFSYANVIGNNYVGVLAGSNISTIEFCVVENSIISGNNLVGSVIGGGFTVGYINVRTEISYVATKNNTISGTSVVGGFAGQIQGNLFCCSSINSDVYGNNESGAFIGRGNNYNTRISNCYSNNNIYSNGDYSAGFIGVLSKDTMRDTVFEIENCYFSGNIIGNAINAFLKINSSSLYYFNVTNCYYDSTVCDKTDSYATGKTTEELQQGQIPDTAVFVDWDPTIWNSVDNMSYPELLWEL